MKKQLFSICVWLTMCIPPLGAAEVWVAATGPFGNGSSASMPLDGSGLGFTALMNSFPNDTKINLAAGTYDCNGDIVPKPGWIVIGAGMNATKIVRTNVGANGTSSVFINYLNEAHYYYFSDFEIDLSGSSTPSTPVNAIPAVCETRAIMIYGLNSLIERVRVRDPRCTLPFIPGYGYPEGFPLAICNDKYTNAVAKIAYCEVLITTPDSYMTTVHIAGQNNGSLCGMMLNNLVSYSGPDNPPSGGSRGISAYGSGAVHNLLIQGNTSIYAGNGITMDTWNHFNVSIIGNQFLDCSGGGFVIGAAPGLNQQWDNFVVRDNVITTRWRGMIFNGSCTNFKVSNNSVSASAPSAQVGLEIYQAGNSGFELYGNQINSGLPIGIDPANANTIAIARNNQTGAAVLPGNVANVTQPVNGPVTVGANSLTVAHPGVGKLEAKSTGSTDGQLWLTSDNKSMVFAKQNNANRNSLAIFLTDGVTNSTIAHFSPEGWFNCYNVRIAGDAPEGSGNPWAIAGVGAIYTNYNGTPGNTLYVKESAGPGGAPSDTGWKKVLTESNRPTATTTVSTAPTVSPGNSLDFATVTVSGAAIGDTVMVGLPNSPATQIVFSAYVSAANQVTIRAYNIAGANRTVPNGTYRATVLK